MVYSTISDSIGTITQFTRYQNVTLSHTGTLTDYQKKITIPWQEGMQAGFNDIRFNDASGNYVNYWIESKTDSDAADVWIKNDYLSGDTVITMYYGNAGLSSGSSISSVGETGSTEFDDLVGWTQQAGTWTQSGSTVTAPNAANSHLRCDTPITESEYRIEAKIKGVGNYYHGILIAEADTPMVHTAAIESMLLNANSGNPNTVSGAYNWGTSNYASFTVNDVYYILGLKVSSGANVPYASLIDRTGLVEGSSFANGAGTGNYFGLFSNPDSTQYVTDWYLVRKYTATEPTYSIGSEQHQRRVPTFIN